jgi:hypothetical protein
MRRMYEFVCEDSHISEAFVEEAVRETPCRECGKPAKRIVSAVQMKLEPFTGSFPTAYDAWNRKRAEKLAIEQKQNA